MSRRFLQDLAERAVKTAAQAALLVLGADQVDALHADWQTVAGMALGGAALSVLSSLGSLRIGAPDTASALPAQKTPSG